MMNEEIQQVLRVIGNGGCQRRGRWFLMKLNITKKGTEGPVRRCRKLTEISPRTLCYFRQYLIVTFRLFYFSFVLFWFSCERGSCCEVLAGWELVK